MKRISRAVGVRAPRGAGVSPRPPFVFRSSRIRMHARRATAAILFLTIVARAVSGVGYTVAYFNDIEVSRGNYFQAWGLDFALLAGAWSPVASSTDINPGETVSRHISVLDDFSPTSLPFHYVLRSTGTPSALCAALTVNAFLEGISTYSGGLFDFVSATTTYGPSADDWRFDVTLPLAAADPGTAACAFDFVFEGWQEPFASSTMQGFHDSERADNALASIATLPPEEPPLACGANTLADFDTDGAGGAISPGQIIDDEYGARGLRIRATNEDSDGPHQALAFDSAHPSSSDEKFGTPNEDFGGPGEGSGGKSGKPGENKNAQFNVLVIDDRDDDDDDDDHDDDDDDDHDDDDDDDDHDDDDDDDDHDDHDDDDDDPVHPDTGTLFFNFDTPTYVKSILVVNNDDDDNTIVVYNEFGSIIKKVVIPDLGKNSTQTINLDVHDVKEIRVVMEKAVAVDDICFDRADGAHETPASPVVLNEFLPNPEGKEYGFDFGSDDSSKPKGEWIEIYNNGSAPFSVNGWYTWDASGSNSNKVFITPARTNLATTTVAAHGWLVVYMNKRILNNDHDTVKLYNGFDVLVDGYSYGSPADHCDAEPSPGGGNIATTTPGCAGVPGNKSYARIPDGTGAWVDPIPTPGDVNILEDESAVETAGGAGASFDGGSDAGGAENAREEFPARIEEESGDSAVVTPAGDGVDSGLDSGLVGGEVTDEGSDASVLIPDTGIEAGDDTEAGEEVAVVVDETLPAPDPDTFTPVDFDNNETPAFVTEAAEGEIVRETGTPDAPLSSEERADDSEAILPNNNETVI